MRSLRIAAVLWLALGAAWCRADSPIVLMVGGMNKIIYLPAIVAQRQGYFRKLGLHVEVVSEPAGSNAEDELIAGAVQGVVGFYDHCIDLQSKGYAIESVIQLTRVPGEVELTQAGRAGADLRAIGARRLGVTDIGSSTDFLSRYLALRAGLQPSQYRLVPVDAGDRFMEALRAGHIDAGMTTDPTVTRLLDAQGARILVDLRSVRGMRSALGGDYPASSVYMQRAWVDAHPSQVRGIVQAFLMALRYLRSHDAATVVASLPPAFVEGHRAAYVKALQAFRPEYSPDGRMPADGPTTVLAVLQAINPDVRGGDIDLSRTYTEKFLPRRGLAPPAGR
nr:ABC transporter substrate-binding protein [Thiomonas sp. FB-6]